MSPNTLSYSLPLARGWPRRARRPAVLVCMSDIISAFQIVSTESGEAHLLHKFPRILLAWRGGSVRQASYTRFRIVYSGLYSASGAAMADIL